MQLIHNLDPELFREWNETHPFGEILQSEEWGQFKSKGEWTYELLGLTDNQVLVGACMLLKRKLPLIHKYMFYASRGFLCDYTNVDVVKEFTALLAEHIKKQQGIMLKIDPCVEYREYDSEGVLIEGGFNNQNILDQLLKIGYKHKGISLNFDGIQPRFVYQLALDGQLEEILNRFHPKTRYNIKLASKKGIEIVEGSREDLIEFQRIMKITGERDGFITRKLSYFQEMYDTFYPKDKLKLYLAKYNVSEALKLAMQSIEQEQKAKKPDIARIDKLNNEILELSELVKQYPNGIIVSGTLMLINGKTAVYLYGASDNLYRNVMPNYLIQWKMIQDAYQLGCKVYDFRGISGDLSEDNPLYGLFRFKKGFTGRFVEYIGEFDYVVRPFYYMCFEWGVPRIKALLKKVRK
jgi:peptidoglycan pentaglycine glycine transferase (the first glycine)